MLTEHSKSLKIACEFEQVGYLEAVYETAHFQYTE